MISGSVGFPVGKEVGYIRISTFNKRTGELFTEQLNELKQAGVNAFVLDIRNNGGGYFPAGVQVCLKRNLDGCPQYTSQYSAIWL